MFSFSVTLTFDL